jgi:hypothetical protein
VIFFLLLCIFSLGIRILVSLIYSDHFLSEIINRLVFVENLREYVNKLLPFKFQFNLWLMLKL